MKKNMLAIFVTFIFHINYNTFELIEQNGQKEVNIIKDD
jgi:hypothetical protein